MPDKCVLQLHSLCPEVLKYEVMEHILKEQKKVGTNRRGMKTQKADIRDSIGGAIDVHKRQCSTQSLLSHVCVWVCVC